MRCGARRGFTPGLAVRLRLAGGLRVFAKGIPADHVLAGKYRAEATTARQLPEATPAPRLRWDAYIAGWVVLAFDDIDGRQAQLGPGSADIGPVSRAWPRCSPPGSDLQAVSSGGVCFQPR